MSRVPGRGSGLRKLYTPSVPERTPKNRRTTPFSNWECDPAAPYPIPTEFDLRGFAFTALPPTHQDYDRFNNDMVIGHYRPSDRSYSGSQRKGISEPPHDTASHMDHIQEALKAPFPLAEQTPIPGDLITTLKFQRDNSRREIRDFIASQLREIRAIAQECMVDTGNWYESTPTELKNTNGAIHIALLAHITRFTRMKGANWLTQFIVGPPITGELRQKAVFQLKKEGL